ncbi:MAG: serine/threonine protein phosphatase [Candidatus Neomarinimicrobiota bacterium]|nr:MAG: serine/threonine protein phosphatase [Candidatus Neomarinimicrobiota bacterium]
MKTYVVGDIHGAYRALEQVVERAPIHPEEDRLIVLGDVSDGWSQTREAVSLLLTFPGVILLAGNHDEWTARWMESGEVQPIHAVQGGQATVASYREGIPAEHLSFFQKAKPYFLDEKNRLYLHAGFEPDIPLEQQQLSVFTWDRSLFMAAALHREQFHIREYDRVFIGHTPTLRYDSSARPLIWGNLINLDQGAGWDGKLTLMDADSLEYWQSDWVTDLYPDEPGRLGSRR